MRRNTSDLHFLVTQILYPKKVLFFLGVSSDSDICCTSDSFCVFAVDKEETSEKTLAYAVVVRPYFHVSRFILFCLERLEPEHAHAWGV